MRRGRASASRRGPRRVEWPKQVILADGFPGSGRASVLGPRPLPTVDRRSVGWFKPAKPNKPCVWRVFRCLSSRAGRGIVYGLPRFRRPPASKAAQARSRFHRCRRRRMGSHRGPGDQRSSRPSSGEHWPMMAATPGGRSRVAISVSNHQPRWKAICAGRGNEFIHRRCPQDPRIHRRRRPARSRGARFASAIRPQLLEDLGGSISRASRPNGVSARRFPGSPGRSPFLNLQIAHCGVAR